MFVLLEKLFNISESNDERLRGTNTEIQPSNKATMPQYNNETVIDEQADFSLQYAVF